MKNSEKSKKSKEKLVQAAFSLFSSKGYDATTTQEIINQSGLSRGAMYHHFKSKEDILNKVVDEIHLSTNEFLTKLVDDDILSPQEKILKIIDYSTADPIRKKLTHLSWIEKVPFALLNEVRNGNNVFAVYLTKIIDQYLEIEGGDFEYTKELAELVILVVDVFLNPVITKSEQSEICRRIDFLLYILDNLGIQLIDKDSLEEIKSFYGNLYLN